MPRVSWPTPYMGSTMTLQAGLADGFDVDQLLDRVHVFVGDIAQLDDAGLEGHVQLELDDFVRP